VHAALCAPRAEPLHWTTYLPGRPVVNGIDGTSVQATSGIYEFMPKIIKETWWSWATPADVAAWPTIACTSPSALLVALGVTHVDLWILDVEGAELEVLRTVDFAALTVDVIVAELDGHNAEKDAGCAALLSAAGFEDVGSTNPVTRNHIFMRRDFRPSADPAGVPRQLRGAATAVSIHN
jgi:hypothetical protein